MMLADLTTNVSVGVALFCALLATAGQITTWLTVKSAQKRIISFDCDPIDKEDCLRQMAQHQGELEKLHERIASSERCGESRLQKFMDEFISSRRSMHRDIEEIKLAVAALKQAGEIYANTLIRFEGKFDRVLERNS